MKKTLFLAIIPVFLLVYADPATAENIMQWSVQSMRVKISSHREGELVQKFRQEYYLYFGNEDTRERDVSHIMSRTSFCIYLTHPPTEEGSLGEDPHGWYLHRRLSRYGTSGMQPLFDETIWEEVPASIKHTLRALGADDPDLLTIRYDLHTSSIRVFFHPKHKEDLDFHQHKLKRVVEYFAHPESAI